jgi:hypothetical protein
MNLEVEVIPVSSAKVAHDRAERLTKDVHETEQCHRYLKLSSDRDVPDFFANLGFSSWSSACSNITGKFRVHFGSIDDEGECDPSHPKNTLRIVDQVAFFP